MSVVSLHEILEFFIPRKVVRFANNYNTKKIHTAAIIPTYAPSILTYDLVRSILKWYPNIFILLVDDCTPKERKDKVVFKNLKKLAAKHTKFKMIRTPQNALKAGALNYGLETLYNEKQKFHIVFTMDDDIVIDSNTLTLIQQKLYSQKKIAAVCSSARVLNKNKNIVTRLQALEYHNFNITKIADNSLFNGPLVMQGMLTGFRLSALKDVKGFTKGHLIEDYDITARLKKRGWKVGIESKAIAWTSVPENLGSLWKQRVRWTYGGLKVVGKFWKNLRVVFQDLVGHLLFLLLAFLVFISLILDREKQVDPTLNNILLGLALLQLIISTGYNILSLSSYKDRELKDWLLKLTVIPEFIYSNIMSFVLIGAYLFYFYQEIIVHLVNNIKPLYPIYRYGLVLFQKIGYSSTWGTKQSPTKGGIFI